MHATGTRQANPATGSGERARHGAARLNGHYRAVRGDRTVVATCRGERGERGERGVAARQRLTVREGEVLRRMAEGESNRHIAECLGITEGTVRTHAQNVLMKLGVRSRAQAAAIVPTRSQARSACASSSHAPLSHLRSGPGTAASAHPDAAEPRSEQAGVAPRTSRSIAPGPTSGPELLALLAGSVTAAPDPVRRAHTRARLDRLTARETQVLRCLAAGISRHAIAQRLYISPNTVRTHVRNVLAKLEVHSALAAAAILRQAAALPAAAP